jgi:hypothetical protein
LCLAFIEFQLSLVLVHSAGPLLLFPLTSARVPLSFASIEIALLLPQKLAKLLGVVLQLIGGDISTFLGRRSH